MFVSNPVNEIYLLWKFPAGLELVVAVCIGQALKFSFWHCFVATAMRGLLECLC